MAAADRRLPAGLLAGWLAGAACLAPTACSHTAPPEPEEPSAFSVPPTVNPPPPPPPPRETPRPTTPTVVQISPVATEEEGGSLVEAAKAERERRQKGSGQSVAVINNQNLASYAEGGKLTYVEESATPGAGAPAQPGTLAQEAFWRNRALEIRLQWRRAVEDIEQLKLRAADLRQRFYAEDDPFVRDGQVKPEWDRTLEQLNQARDDARRYQAELDRLYEEARQADVEPAWLQEGIDLEPPAEPAEPAPGDLPEHEVKEPPEVGGGRQ